MATNVRAFHNLRLIGTALAVLILISTLGFHFIEGWSWLDSLYMVVTTLTTVGYREIHDLSSAGRIFNIGVILAGVSLLFLGIGSLTQALLEFELRNFFGRRKMEREIGRLSDHYIICGIGRVGRSAARELARKPAPFVVIDQNEPKTARFQGDWLTIIGDATQEQVLRQANIERARGLVAATTTDATNLYIVMTARELNPRLKIIARASEEDAERRFLKAGADSVVSPYHFAGQRIAQSFLRPHVVSFLDTATTHLGMDLEIGEILVRQESSLSGKTIETSRIRQEAGVIVLAIKHQEAMRFSPSSDDRIDPGDYLIAMGEPQQLKRLEQMASSVG
ncbi:MAG TPA: potassium channel protein [Terriglobales bacterium]